MKVKQLIELLSQCDPEKEVELDDMNGGYVPCGGLYEDQPGPHVSLVADDNPLLDQPGALTADLGG